MVGRCSRVSREKMDACSSFRRPSRAPTTRAKLAEIGGTKKCPILGHIKSEQAIADPSRRWRSTLGRPRDLHQLRNEHEFGLGGRKPGRQFTPVERGAVKFSYSRRKIAWDAIDRMVRSGATAQVWPLTESMECMGD